MLVADEASLTNSALAKKLNVSQAAINEGCEALIKSGNAETYRDEMMLVLYYRLTEIGVSIALLYQHHHQHTPFHADNNHYSFNKRSQLTAKKLFWKL